MKEDALDIDWGYIVDLLASEYGWTIAYIGELNLGQIKCLCDAIRKRYDKKNGKDEDTQDGQGIPEGSDNELKLSDFEHQMGGKRVVHDDGTIEIIV